MPLLPILFPYSILITSLGYCRYAAIIFLWLLCITASPFVYFLVPVSFVYVSTSFTSSPPYLLDFLKCNKKNRVKNLMSNVPIDLCMCMAVCGFQCPGITLPPRKKTTNELYRRAVGSSQSCRETDPSVKTLRSFVS